MEALFDITVLYNTKPSAHQFGFSSARLAQLIRRRAVACSPTAPIDRRARSYLSILSSNTMTSGGLPGRSNSFQRETTWSYVFLSSFVRGENLFMCL